MSDTEILIGRLTAENHEFKKLKLIAKDRMEVMIRQARAAMHA